MASAAEFPRVCRFCGTCRRAELEGLFELPSTLARPQTGGAGPASPMYSNGGGNGAIIGSKMGGELVPFRRADAKVGGSDELVVLVVSALVKKRKRVTLIG